MTDPNTTATVIEQGKALVRAIVAAAPSWVSEEISSASQHIGDDRAAIWFSEN